jgi:hypothetical protein
LKTAHDKKNLYFYAETTEDITPASVDDRMRLYLDTDRNHLTGWNSYDYRIVSGNILQQYTQHEWKEVQTVVYSLEKNKLMITVPLESLGISDNRIHIVFKWSDNMQSEYPMDWYVNGEESI